MTTYVTFTVESINIGDGDEDDKYGDFTDGVAAGAFAICGQEWADRDDLAHRLCADTGWQGVNIGPESPIFLHPDVHLRHWHQVRVPIGYLGPEGRGQDRIDHKTITVADVTYDGAEFRIVNGHQVVSAFSTSGDEGDRRKDAWRKQIRAYFAEVEGHTVTTMDANATLRHVEGFAPAGWSAAKTGPTIRHRRIDFVGHTRGIEVASARTLETSGSRKRGDHRGVLAELRIPRATKPKPTPPEVPVTERSYNGWPASRDRTDIHIVGFIVAGVSFVPGVRAGDVHTVLGHVAQQFNDRVEKLVDPGCWGYFYRQNRNADNLSCHSSGTAIDCNAPQHPNGIEASQNYSGKQIAEIHKILAEIPELAETVHWGGDWHRSNGLTPDPMHFEIHDHDTAKLRRVADRIRNHQEDDMPAPKDVWEGSDVADEIPAPKIGGEFVGGYSDKNPGASPRHALGRTWQGVERLLAMADPDAFVAKVVPALKAAIGDRAGLTEAEAQDAAEKAVRKVLSEGVDAS